jgi:sugar lactone lactonase YvrE
MSIEVDTMHHQVIVGARARGKHGRGPGEFHYPSRAVVLGERAYVCDSWNHRVQVFELPHWKFAFEFADFCRPQWIEIIERPESKTLVVVDTKNARLCFHQANGQRIATYAFEPESLPVSARALDAETLEVVFDDEHIEMLDVSGILQPADWTARLENPTAIVRDLRGSFYVGDSGRRTVDKFDREGKFVAEVLGPGVLNLPGKMIMNGDDLVVVDRVTNTVLIYDTKAGKHRRWDYAFEEPGCIACDPRGNIWVGSNTSGPNPKGATILIFDSRYQFVRNVRFRKSRQPVSIAFAKDQVLIADQDARNVLAFSEDGTFAGSLREQPYDA